MTRKIDNDLIVALNGVGLSLMEISDRIGCHPSTITNRLGALGISAVDTRRSFMGDVFRSLTPLQQEWLMDRAISGHSIKDFVTQLIKLDYGRQIRKPK